MAIYGVHLAASMGKSGLTLHIADRGTAINAGGDALSEVGNGYFTANVAEELSNKSYQVWVQQSGSVIYTGFLNPGVSDVVNDRGDDPASGGGAGLTGPHVITITVTDGTDPIENATIRMHRTGETESQPTDASGEAEFTVDAATWSVSITADGFVGQTAELIVSGDAQPQYTLTPNGTPTPPSDPSLCVIDCYVINPNGTPEVDAVISARLVKANSSIDGRLVSRSFPGVSTDSAGFAQIELIRQDQFTDGDGKFKITATKLGVTFWEVETVIPNQSNANLEDLLN